MIIIERNKIRIIFYSGYIIIMLLLVVTLAVMFTTALQREHQIKIKQLKESILFSKKNYIKDTVEILFQEIDLDNQSTLKELQADANALSLSIRNYLESMSEIKKANYFSLLKSVPLYVDFLIFDQLNKKVLATTGIFNQLQHINNPQRIVDIAKSNPVSNVRRDIVNRYLVATGTTQQWLDSVVQEKVKNRIRTFRLLDNGYFWVNKILNYNGGKDYAIRLIHPNLPHTEGSFLSTLSTDIKGNLPYKEELEGVKTNGEVFFEYYFKKKGTEKIAHKMTYAKLYKPYDWVIATGVYLDDITTLVQHEKSRMQQTHNRQILRTVLLSIVCMCFSGLIMYFFESRLYKLLRSYSGTIKDRENALKNQKLSIQKALQLARESEKQYRSLFKNMTEAFALCELLYDSNGTPVDFEYRDINTGFESALNKKRDGVVGKKFTEVFPEFEQETTGWISIVSKVVRTGQSVNMEFYSEMGKKWFYVNAYKIQENQFAIIFVDISPMKEKEKLAGVLELSGAVCHELSQPLQAVNGYSDLLLMEISESDPSFKKLKKIKTEIERMGALIQKLSGITRYKTMDFAQGKIIDIKEASD